MNNHTLFQNHCQLLGLVENDLVLFGTTTKNIIYSIMVLQCPAVIFMICYKHFFLNLLHFCLNRQKATLIANGLSNTQKCFKNCVLNFYFFKLIYHKKFVLK